MQRGCWVMGVTFAVACGGGAGAAGGGDPTSGPSAQAASGTMVTAEVSSAAERARAGGFCGEGLQAPPHYCNDEGGTEWCDGAVDDDCDGLVDEGCVDCARERCVRFEIPEADMQRGAGRSGSGVCVGPVYCGRVDGVATTSPPGGCGSFHCATVVWGDGTAQPNHCTISGRCTGGEFVAQGFSW